MTAIYLMILAAFTMREALLWINTTFLPKTPIVFLLVIYSALIIFLVASGLQTIVIVNVFVLFGVVTFGFLVAFVNLQVKEYELLRPFFEHGFKPVLMGSIYPASGYIELLLILFLQHRISNRIKWHHFAIMLLIITGLTMGPLVGAITEFGPSEASKQRYPPYEEWGLATIGRFIEHIDFFSIYQWLTGAFIRVGLILYICSELFNISEDKKKVWKYIAPPFFFICLSLILLRDNLFLKINGSYFLMSTLLFFFILSLILVMIALISKKTYSKDQNQNQNINQNQDQNMNQNQHQNINQKDQNMNQNQDQNMNQNQDQNMNQNQDQNMNQNQDQNMNQNQDQNMNQNQDQNMNQNQDQNMNQNQDQNMNQNQDQNINQNQNQK